ncbi:MAG: dipeptidase [Variibacter sp.]
MSEKVVNADAKEKARALYRDAVVWDDLLSFYPNTVEEDTLHRVHAAGVTLVSLTVGQDTFFVPTNAMRLMLGIRAFCRKNPDFIVVDKAQDIVEAKKGGKTALTFNLQGMNSMAGDITLIEQYYAAGVRQMLLAYNQTNMVAGGCAEHNDTGLSRFGIRVIKEMNRVGMLVDGTHVSYRSTMEAMEICEGPFIFSHSNAYALCPHYRNIKDDQIKSCAATGGVIGINGFGMCLGDVDAKPETIFKHIDYMVNLVGEKHVGIGSDYYREAAYAWSVVLASPDKWPPNDGVDHTVTGFATPEQLVDLTELMVGHGYPDESISNILGGNFLRVASQVWK